MFNQFLLHNEVVNIFRDFRTESKLSSSVIIRFSTATAICAILHWQCIRKLFWSTIQPPDIIESTASFDFGEMDRFQSKIALNVHFPWKSIANVWKLTKMKDAEIFSSQISMENEKVTNSKNINISNQKSMGKIHAVNGTQRTQQKVQDIGFCTFSMEKWKTNRPMKLAVDCSLI